MGNAAYSIKVEAPIDACFRIWDDPQSVPYLIEPVRDFTTDDHCQVFWNWVATDPEGHCLQWQTLVTERQSDGPNRRLSWESVYNGPVYAWGSVLLHAEAINRTFVTLEMEFDRMSPSEFSAHLFDNPEPFILECLRNFQSYVEKRKHAYM